MTANTDFDLDMAMEYCAGDPDIFHDVLDAYLEQGQEYLQQIPKIMDAKDYPSYQIITHAIKSSSKTIGASAFSEKAREQEFLIKDGKTDMADATWKSFLDEFKKILDEAAELQKS
ncbi:MAG: Hpt domain-containing protein [Eubacterium sp.]|nr:Hpt domain-containing protein [Eubacterium sp.]